MNRPFLQTLSLTFLTAAVLTGCADDDRMAGVQPAGGTITFAISETPMGKTSPLTRANPNYNTYPGTYDENGNYNDNPEYYDTGTTLTAGKTIRVWGFKGAENIFDDNLDDNYVDVTLTSENSQILGRTTTLWPTEGGVMKFFAVWPAPLNFWRPSVTDNGDGTYYYYPPTLRYRNADGRQTDILLAESDATDPYAYPEDGKPYSAGDDWSNVTLKFRHMLSAINFKLDDDLKGKNQSLVSVRIKGVWWYGFYNYASTPTNNYYLNYPTSGNIYHPTTGNVWTHHLGTGDVEDPTYYGTVTLRRASGDIGDNDWFYMMPQLFGLGTTPTRYTAPQYVATLRGTDGAISTISGIIDQEAWYIGESYTYTLHESDRGSEAKTDADIDITSSSKTYYPLGSSTTTVPASGATFPVVITGFTAQPTETEALVYSGGTTETPDYATLTNYDSSTGTATYLITLPENTVTETRTYTMTVSNGTYTATIVIVQEAAEPAFVNLFTSAEGEELSTSTLKRIDITSITSQIVVGTSYFTISYEITDATWDTNYWYYQWYEGWNYGGAINVSNYSTRVTGTTYTDKISITSSSASATFLGLYGRRLKLKSVDFYPKEP